MDGFFQLDASLPSSRIKFAKSDLIFINQLQVVEATCIWPGSHTVLRSDGISSIGVVNPADLTVSKGQELATE